MSDNQPTSLDPLTADTRELMQALLPAMRSKYIKAWELLADPETLLERRRNARARAAAIAEDHELLAATLKDRERRLAGDDRLNIRHLASELERHAEAMKRISTISVVGLKDAKDLRPEALGCGKRYKDPTQKAATTSGSAGSKTSGARGKQRPKPGREQEKNRAAKHGNKDRGSKIAKGMLGTSKHDSSLGDDLTEETRLKLEAMKAALEANS